MSSVWVLAIFKKFQARYLHKWTSAIEGIEEEAMREWSQVLAGLTGEQVKHGFDSWSEAWPPSADEFRAACVGGGNGFGLDYTPEVYRQRPDPNVKKITSQHTDKIRHENLGKMRDVMRAAIKGESDEGILSEHGN